MIFILFLLFWGEGWNLYFTCVHAKINSKINQQEPVFCVNRRDKLLCFIQSSFRTFDFRAFIFSFFCLCERAFNVKFYIVWYRLWLGDPHHFCLNRFLPTHIVLGSLLSLPVIHPNVAMGNLWQRVEYGALSRVTAAVTGSIVFITNTILFMYYK